MKRFNLALVVTMILACAAGAAQADTGGQQALSLVLTMAPDDYLTEQVLARMGITQLTLAEEFRNRLRARGVPVTVIYAPDNIPSDPVIPAIEILFQPIQPRDLTTGLPSGQVAYSLAITFQVLVNVRGDSQGEPFLASPVVMTGVGAADQIVFWQTLSTNIDQLVDRFATWYFG